MRRENEVQWTQWNDWLEKNERRSGGYSSGRPERVRVLVGVGCSECPWSFGVRDGKPPETFKIYQAFYDHNSEVHDGRATKIPRYENVTRENLNRLNQ